LSPPSGRRAPPRGSPGFGRPVPPRRPSNHFAPRGPPPRRSPGYDRFDGSPPPPNDRFADNEPPCTVYVGGLPPHTTPPAVQDFFERYGAVERVKLIHHHDSGEFRGFGFVSFRDPAEAAEACEDAPGRELLGNRIRCNLARYNRAPPGGALGPQPPPMRGPPPGPMRCDAFAWAHVCFISPITGAAYLGLRHSTVLIASKHSHQMQDMVAQCVVNPSIAMFHPLMCAGTSMTVAHQCLPGPCRRDHVCRLHGE
jgi:RNA recognition motif. (a.k.a. RRM, RBD, or RNP domain)